MSSLLSSSFALAHGPLLPHRLVKAAMSENLAHHDGSPGDALFNLYSKWFTHKLGLCLSGNVMIDTHHRNEPFNMVIEPTPAHRRAFERLAACKGSSPGSFWLQLNHPGKQIPKFLQPQSVGPSAIPLGNRLNKIFATPRALSHDEIITIIDRFVAAAKFAEDCGFDGVQIHGAHGYLISQFLSPLHNQRQDAWGGDEKRRMAFLLSILEGVRRHTSAKFALGLKLNSADFQKGGMTPESAIRVAQEAEARGLDLLEVSGGTYEAPVMMGQPSSSSSTRQREAYFLEYAEELRRHIRCPLMVTGGFRTGLAMESALNSGALDLIGLGRPLAVDPTFIETLLDQPDHHSIVRPITTGYKWIDRTLPLEIVWYTEQMTRISAGQAPKPQHSPWSTTASILKDIVLQSFKTLKSPKGV